MFLKEHERVLKEIAEDRKVNKMMRMHGPTAPAAGSSDAASSRPSIAKASEAVPSNSSTSIVCSLQVYHHHHHLSLNCEGRLGTADDFTTSFLHFSLFSTVLLDLPNSRPVRSLMLSSHLFLCRPCLLPPFTVPCKMVLARPDEQVACVSEDPRCLRA